MLAEDVQHGVDFALRLAHGKALQLGRHLHINEVRWVVRAGFRERYIGLDAKVANQYADRMIHTISMCQ